MRANQKTFYLAQRRYERWMRSLDWLAWWPMRARTGSIARNRMYTGGVGAELLTNEDFGAWTADDPDDWTVTGESGSDPEVSEVGSGQGHGGAGTGAANFYSGSTSGQPRMNQGAILTVGDTYRVRTVISAASGLVRFLASIGLGDYGVGDHSLDFISKSTTPQWLGVTAPIDVTLDSASIRKVGEIDALIAGTTSLAQTGWRGVGEALLLDGATSILTVAQRAGLNGLAEFSLWMLFKPSSAGEGDAGVLFSKSGEFSLNFNSSSRDLIATVEYDGSAAETLTTTTLSANQWHTVGVRIDNTSKVADIFIDGQEAAYDHQTAGAGTRVSNTNDLIVGNNEGVTGTLAGLLDEAAIVGRALSDSEWLQLHRLAGLD